MEHVSTASSWPMTLRALGGPGRSQSKCHTSRAPSISHSKEECPCTADGKAGWVPTIFHPPTKLSNCLSEPVGCGGGSECFFIVISLSWSCLASPKQLTLRPPYGRLSGHLDCKLLQDECQRNASVLYSASVAQLMFSRPDF